MPIKQDSIPNRLDVLETLDVHITQKLLTLVLILTEHYMAKKNVKALPFHIICEICFFTKKTPSISYKILDLHMSDLQIDLCLMKTIKS
mgnify:FL=1